MNSSASAPVGRGVGSSSRSDPWAVETDRVPRDVEVPAVVVLHIAERADGDQGARQVGWRARADEHALPEAMGPRRYGVMPAVTSIGRRPFQSAFTTRSNSSPSPSEVRTSPRPRRAAMTPPPRRRPCRVAARDAASMRRRRRVDPPPTAFRPIAQGRGIPRRCPRRRGSAVRPRRSPRFARRKRPPGIERRRDARAPAS